MRPETRRAEERSRTHGALAAASRVRILELLRDSGAPLDVQQIAAQTSLHHNTVRFHLKVLIDAGLACCRPDPRGVSGRPRLVYLATTSGSGGQQPDGFQLLADILASYLAAHSATPTGLAEEAGRAFARRHRRPTQPFTNLSADEVVQRVAAMFAELGFEPELDSDPALGGNPTPDRDPTPDRGRAHHRILLHTCPFHAIASKHPDVVCAIHLGLLKQTLADLDAPVEAIGLEPFVTPHLCIAHLATIGNSPAGH